MPDPFDLALSFADDLGEGELRAVVERRCAAIVGELEELDRQRSAAAPYLGRVDEAVIEHIRERLCAEQRWHAVLVERLPGVVGAAGREPPARAITGGEPTPSKTSPVLSRRIGT